MLDNVEIATERAAVLSWVPPSEGQVCFMIQVTRLNKIDKFWVNEDLLEFMEETPDTVLAMSSGRKTVVSESAAQIQRLILQAKAQPLLLSRQEAGLDEETFP
jgi:flagellar protein FlbD